VSHHGTRVTGEDTGTEENGVGEGEGEYGEYGGR